MSYQVLARKWRPQSFDEVAGQSHVTTALRNAIRTDRVPHALLLTGPRGVGKTSIARILARCLNCEKGPTDTPCGTCQSCTEISSGHSTDVREVDAASRTSVDDVRELIEAVRYAPSPGKHRIFVVDEVHMLSTAAFNALLKTLEEPPPRSLFVLATTNPEKIPTTVLSRCQRYDLRRIATAEVASHLATIAEAEGLRVSEQSLRDIAREGEGSMRDAQTLLDQLVAYGGTEISEQTVAEVLDLIDRRVILAILGACIDSDAAAALEACARAGESGSDVKRLGAALTRTLRDLVVLRVAPKASDLVEGGDEEISELRNLAERAEPARLRRMFRALVSEQEDLAWAPDPFAALEMAVVRLASMPSGDDISQLISRLDALERNLAGDNSGPQGSGGTPRQRPERRGPAKSEAHPARRESRGSEKPAETRAPAGAPDAGAPDAGAPLEVVFDRLRGFAQQENRGLFASLDGGRLLECGDEKLTIEVSASFHEKRLRDRIAELEQVCARFFGRPLRVTLCTRGSGRSGPEKIAPAAREQARQRRQAALQHPAVNIALKQLQAEIVEIVPLGKKQ